MEFQDRLPSSVGNEHVRLFNLSKKMKNYKLLISRPVVAHAYPQGIYEVYLTSNKCFRLLPRFPCFVTQHMDAIEVFVRTNLHLQGRARCRLH